MRAVFTILFSFLFSGVATANCDGPNFYKTRPLAERTALEAAAAKVPYNEGLLWRVEKQGVVSHIIGTFHMHLPEHADMVTRIAELQPQPETVFLELTKADQLGFQRHLTNNPDVYLIEDGPSLIDRLTEEEWAQISDLLRERGLPSFLAARYQPWFLGLTLMMPACALELAQSGKEGLDMQIEDFANYAGYATKSLDDTETLLEILGGDPLEEQVKDLRWGLSIEGDPAAPEMTPALMQMYVDEQIQLIWEVSMADTMKAVEDDADAAKVAMLMQEVETDLIVARNTGWMQVLSPALSEAPSLVAVGALHLPGEQGLLALLQADGYAVSRVPLWTN